MEKKRTNGLKRCTDSDADPIREPRNTSIALQKTASHSCIALPSRTQSSGRRKEQNLMKCFKKIPENRCVDVNDVPMILFEKNGPSQIEVDSC